MVKFVMTRQQLDDLTIAYASDKSKDLDIEGFLNSIPKPLTADDFNVTLADNKHSAAAHSILDKVFYAEISRCEDVSDKLTFYMRESHDNR